MAIEKYVLPLKEVIPITEGGTGANTVEQAVENLGLNKAVVDIDNTIVDNWVTFKFADGTSESINITDILDYQNGFMKLSCGLCFAWGYQYYNNLAKEIQITYQVPFEHETLYGDYVIRGTQTYHGTHSVTPTGFVAELQWYNQRYPTNAGTISWFALGW